MEEVRNQNHYARFRIQPIEFIANNQLNFMQGNIIKYVCRFDAKDGIKDLYKAKHYLEMMIQLEEQKFLDMEEFNENHN